MKTPRYWQTRGLPAILLLPLAALFALISATRRWCWRKGWTKAFHSGVPVIIVGNITAGGTGKTPLVLWIARLLQQQGRHPGIISRGYGAAARHPRPVPANGSAPDFGDEPCLLARRAGCPVWVGVDRAATAAALLRAHPGTDVLISDDGLQHYRLARDMEIAVIDGERGLGNGWLLPAGPLREPASRLDTVDAVVINGNGGFAHPRALPMRMTAGRFHNLLQPELSVQADHFSARPVHAIAGIGNPERFFAQLALMGIRFTPHAFPDHHPYSAADLAFAGEDIIVMTEKDAVKCRTFATARHWMLPIDAAPDSRLGELITARLAKTGRHG